MIEAYQILIEAIGHRDNYEKTNNPGEIFCYLVEMGTLKQHLAVYWAKSRELDKRKLGRYAAQKLIRTDPAEYSNRDLISLSFVLDRLEKPEIEYAIIKECIRRIEEIKETSIEIK